MADFFNVVYEPISQRESFSKLDGFSFKTASTALVLAKRPKRIMGASEIFLNCLAGAVVIKLDEYRNQYFAESSRNTEKLPSRDRSVVYAEVQCPRPGNSFEARKVGAIATKNRTAKLDAQTGY